mmetsp:Transcript_122841/g.244337  ORF Transcript_122841/g.244337 Transcript_122841/m.244337 type:complete len:203 (+) Transcript_122841:152-760(+)
MQGFGPCLGTCQLQCQMLNSKQLSLATLLLLQSLCERLWETHPLQTTAPPRRCLSHANSLVVMCVLVMPYWAKLCCGTLLCLAKGCGRQQLLPRRPLDCHLGSPSSVIVSGARVRPTERPCGKSCWQESRNRPAAASVASLAGSAARGPRSGKSWQEIRNKPAAASAAGSAASCQPLVALRHPCGAAGCRQGRRHATYLNLV